MSWLLLAGLAAGLGCKSTDSNGTPPPPTAGAAGFAGVAAVGGAAGASGMAAGAGGAGMAAAGMGGAGAPAIDHCSRAINEAMTRDISQLGPLGTCIPAGVALACRTEQPEYTCNPMPSADTTSTNKCRNMSDCAVLMTINTNADTMMGPTVSNIVRECGLPYLSQMSCDIIRMETAPCIKMHTTEIMAPGLSDECSSCFIDSLLCNLKCLMHCSLNAEAPECIACMHAEGCRGLFYRCSGLEPMP